MAITGAEIAAVWKILGSLHKKYQAWTVRKSNSKKAQALNERAEELMNEINSIILSGASSDDPGLVPLIKEFRNLLKQDAKPEGHELTEEWITRAIGSKAAAKKVVAKPTAKKAAAPKKVATKPIAKQPTAKKASARRPVAKKVVAKRT